jgi:hypothetical protein
MLCNVFNISNVYVYNIITVYSCSHVLVTAPQKRNGHRRCRPFFASKIMKSSSSLSYCYSCYYCYPCYYLYSCYYCYSCYYYFTSTSTATTAQYSNVQRTSTKAQRIAACDSIVTLTAAMYMMNTV